MSDLLPCPFCGAAAFIEVVAGGEHLAFGCPFPPMGCGFQYPSCAMNSTEGADFLLAKWNRRATMVTKGKAICGGCGAEWAKDHKCVPGETYIARGIVEEFKEEIALRATETAAIQKVRDEMEQVVMGVLLFDAAGESQFTRKDNIRRWLAALDAILEGRKK